MIYNAAWQGWADPDPPTKKVKMHVRAPKKQSCIAPSQPPQPYRYETTDMRAYRGCMAGDGGQFFYVCGASLKSYRITIGLLLLLHVHMDSNKILDVEENLPTSHSLWNSGLLILEY